MRYILALLSVLCFSSCSTTRGPLLKKPHYHIVVERTSPNYQVRSNGQQTVHVLTTTPIDDLALVADMCFIAVEIVKEEWAMTMGSTAAFEEIEDFAIVFMPKANFTYEDTYGFITHRTILHKRMPTAVVRTDMILDAGTSGLGTVSHEVIHALRKDYLENPLNHIQPWYGTNSIEWRVRERLKRLWSVRQKWPRDKGVRPPKLYD